MRFNSVELHGSGVTFTAAPPPKWLISSDSLSAKRKSSTSVDCNVTLHAYPKVWVNISQHFKCKVGRIHWWSTFEFKFEFGAKTVYCHINVRTSAGQRSTSRCFWKTIQDQVEPQIMEGDAHRKHHTGAVWKAISANSSENTSVECDKGWVPWFGKVLPQIQTLVNWKVPVWSGSKLGPFAEEICHTEMMGFKYFTTKGILCGINETAWAYFNRLWTKTRR